jgi:hypothetical protein
MIMKTSRTLFGKHKHGHIFPILLNANLMEGHIMGVVQRVDSSDDYVWFTSKTLKVLGASQTSLLLMGVDSVDVDEGKVDVSRFVSEQQLQPLIDTGLVGTGKQRALSQTVKKLPPELPREFAARICLRWSVHSWCSQFVVTNASKDYIQREFASDRQRKKAREGFKISGRVQVTPFLKTGWIIGHTRPYVLPANTPV